MKKILIGTHNKGKFKELAYLLPKRLKKISPTSLNIRVQKKQANHLSLTLSLR